MAANATVLGNVTLGRGVNIWYGAVLRADEGALILGENSNVQDNAVLHCDPGGQVVLGKNVTVGHSAIVHGCTVGAQQPHRDACYHPQPRRRGQKLHHRGRGAGA